MNTKYDFRDHRAISRSGAPQEYPVASEEGKEPEDKQELVAVSEAMRRVLSTIRKFSQSDAPILITGETGTGKELSAQLTHQNNPRRQDGPFVAVNCGAIPENLIESELFGHEKGAFTGAYAQKKGKAEIADKGTLFLDEVGELPHALQVKLLRFLEDHRFERVGGNQPIEVDVQIIAATNRDLVECVNKGVFREDLYYRLAVLCIHLPPLRERPEDLPLMAENYLKKFSREFGIRLQGFTQEAWDAMKMYAWPGNVRELVNMIRRAVLMAEGDWLGLEDLGFQDIPNRSSSLSLAKAKENLERQYVARALALSNGNISKAARSLGISRPHLYVLMKRYGVHPKSSFNPGWSSSQP